MIVYRNAQLLFAAEISLRGLNAHVSKKKLNLFEFASSHMTQTGASASQIIRREAADTRLRSKFFNYAPDHLFGNALASHHTAPPLTWAGTETPSKNFEVALFEKRWDAFV